MAGLSWGLSPQGDGLRITVSGYGDKLLLLLKQVGAGVAVAAAVGRVVRSGACVVNMLEGLVLMCHMMMVLIRASAERAGHRPHGDLSAGELAGERAAPARIVSCV